MKQKILVAVLLLFSLCICVGCKGYYAAREATPWALEQLEQKYGEPFEYNAPAGSSYTGTRTFFAKCASLGDSRVLVQVVDFTHKEKRVLQDNYIALKYASDVKQFIQDIADSIFGEATVYCGSTSRTLPFDFPVDATLEEYFNCESDLLLSSVIVIPKSNYADILQIKTLLDKIVDNFAWGELSLLFAVVDEDTYESTSESEIRRKFVNRSCIAQVRFSRYNFTEDNLEVLVGGTKEDMGIIEETVETTEPEHTRVQMPEISLPPEDERTPETYTPSMGDITWIQMPDSPLLS